ncbi:MAG: hypothetical protein PHN44_08100 [Candidatus Marinimicrobia bacterium]|nr:hypothetical protein [Candidatus Neomarinimicrobiota bacterium]
MTEEQKKNLMDFLQKFCLDNMGNRLNEWIIEAFLNRAKQKLDAIPTYEPGAVRPTSAAREAKQEKVNVNP